MACYPPPYFAMPAPNANPGLIGKTVYHYWTKGGGPPNDGKPPSTDPSPAPPPYAPFPPFGLQPAPAAAQPGPYFMPPGQGFPNGAICIPNNSAQAPPPQPATPYWYPPPPPAPPAPAAPSWQPPPPPPTVAQTYGGATAKAPEPPVSGNRVKGNLLKDSGGHGHIASKNNATFHLFTENILNKYTCNANQQLFIPPGAQEAFRVMTAAYYMPIEEFIEQLDCIKIAQPGLHPSYIGIAELFDLGHGWFQKGSELKLDDPRAKLTIKEVFGNSIGEAAESRPKWLVRVPGK